MKKALSLLLLLFFTSILWAEPVTKTDSVDVTAHVNAGSGNEGGGVGANGVNILLAVQTVSGTSATDPTKWEDSTNDGVLGDGDDVTAKFSYNGETVGGTESNEADSFFILVGINSNAESTQTVEVSFAPSDWQLTRDGSTTAISQDDMSITSDVSKSTPSDNKLSSSVGNEGTADEKLKVTVSPGLVENTNLVGFSHIEWALNKSPDAGDYSSTITVTISVDGAALAEQGA